MDCRTRIHGVLRWPSDVNLSRSYCSKADGFAGLGPDNHPPFSVGKTGWDADDFGFIDIGETRTIKRNDNGFPLRDRFVSRNVWRIAIGFCFDDGLADHCGRRPTGRLRGGGSVQQK